MKKILFLFILLSLNILLVNKSYASTVFQDDFTDTDGTALSTHNNLWLEYPIGLNEAIINNNQIKSNGSNSGYYIPSLINLTDYCVQADFRQPLPQTLPLDFFDIGTRRVTIPGTHYYSMGYRADNTLTFTTDYGQILFQQTENLTDGLHTAKVCSIGSTHSIYIDTNLITTVTDGTYASGAPGFDLGNNTPIDNFIVTSIDNSGPSVPFDFKQTDPTWSNNPNPVGSSNFIYSTLLDHSSQCKDIYMWGCAITSVADVLKSYGNNTITVNGNASTQIDPGSFNNWMTEKNIFSDCGVIFQYMGASVRIANPLPFWINNNPTRKITAKTMIDNALSQGNLPIIGVNTIYGTHFIVLSQKLSDLSGGTPDYSIIDPAMYPFVANNPGNTGKALSETYKWSNVYETVIFEKNSQPTAKTISFIGHSPIQLLVTDPNGKQTGYQSTSSSYLNDIPASSYGTDHGIADILGETTKAPEAIIYDQNDPIDGTYTLQAYGTGDGSYTIDLMSKTASQNAVHHILSGTATNGKTDNYLINVSSNSNDPIQVQRKVTINVIPNKVNLKSGILGVTITGQSGFDVKNIDTSSVRLGTGEAKPLLNKAFLINDKKNMLLFFSTKQAGIAQNDKEVCLSGNTKAGEGFTGCDSITVISPNNPYKLPLFFNLIGNFDSNDSSTIHQLLDSFRE